MIDTYLVVEYKLSSSSFEDSTNSPSPLSQIKFTKVNINNPQISDHCQQDNISEFINLDNDITQKKVLYKKMLQQMIKIITQLMSNFVNVTLVADDIRIFTEIIPYECQKRELSIPYLMMNFIDMREITRKQCQCPYKKLEDICEYLQIFSTKEAQSKSKTEILQRILKKLHKQNKLLSTNERFNEKCKQLANKLSVEMVQKFKYYKIIGLPFKSFPPQILQLLAPQVPEGQKQLIFIYERQRFSGRGIIKIPQDYEPYLIQKNRMYIGSRYIELDISNEEEFERMKIRSQRRQDSQSPRRDIHNGRSENFQRNVYNIGKRYSPQRQRDPRTREIERQRSRQGRDNFRPYDRYDNKRSQRDYKEGYQQQLDQFGIKVRGLPFAFSEWDVENIFNGYSIVGGSVKLGIKPGTMMKNGQAVILMRSQCEANRAVDMNGYRVMGRYLQVKVIRKDEYLKYK